MAGFVDEDFYDPLDSLPEGAYERALALMNALVDFVAGGSLSDKYVQIRKELTSDPSIKHLLPDVLIKCRDAGAVWGYAKSLSPQWEPRRQRIRESFEPLLGHLESKASPAVDLISGTLSSYDVGGVHAVWDKALKRTQGDPDGAVTAARTLLEEVCKHLLDEGVEPETLYKHGDDLPKLYRLASEKLNLAPSQHSEEAFKRILGGCTSVVEGLGSLRNKVGDAHARGKRQVRVLPRHAHLAVNLAGAMALYLIETWEAHVEKSRA
jgi:hypothetical protein